MKIVYQRNGKPTYDGKRVYIDTEKLLDVGYVPGAKIETNSNPAENEVIFLLSSNGKNKVSFKKKNKKVIPVIDKTGKEIRDALEGCDHITISFIEDIVNGKTEYRVIVKGDKNTATTKKEKQRFNHELKTITFCAGAGISSEAMKQAGFKEVAAVEWNPKEGNEDKFSSLYSKNHPESVVFNLPMEKLQAEHLPYADVWLCTLDCTDYSKSSNGTNKGLHTMHLFIHLMRLFWEKSKEERPIAVLIENVPEFEKIAGNSLELCFKEEGYSVSKAQLNSIEYGSRTKRKRFFMLATLFEGFLFPKSTGVKNTPIIQDGNITLDDLEWVTPEEHGTLNYFLQRQKNKMSHNHVMTVFDITKDSHVGTITKSHHKIQPENWIKHPYKKDTYAYLKAEHIRSIQGIPSHLYLGDSNKLKVESIGQSVCYTLFYQIAKCVYEFLNDSIEEFAFKTGNYKQLTFAI